MSPILPLWLLTVSPTPAQAVGKPITEQPISAWPVSLQRDLDAFSNRWAVRFELVPRPEARRAVEHVDAIELDLVDRVEAALDAARTAMGSLDFEAARRTLDELELLLNEHPELPQAAWLLAERHHAAADLLERSSTEPRAKERAQQLREQANALEGPRAMPFREETARDSGQGLSSPIALAVAGLGPRDRMEWDGLLRTETLSTRPGKHHVRVLRDEHVLWAAWVQVSAEQRVLTLPLPSSGSCTGEELSATVDGDPGPLAPAGVTCSQWAVARTRGAALEVALCRRQQCGRWYGVQPEPTWFRGPAQPRENRGFPRWAIYTGLGAGAALALGIVVASSGVFGRGSPRENWQYEGLK